MYSDNLTEMEVKKIIMKSPPTTCDLDTSVTQSQPEVTTLCILSIIFYAFNRDGGKVQ